ncbi:hypothetical protein K439DRAFT_710746 [Ramaria rubella]|nr:hypothetical protein K439DRAFT_710746 [Ramaria rubella]
MDIFQLFQAASPLAAFLVLGITKENLAAVVAILLWCKKPQKSGVDAIQPARVDCNVIKQEIVDISGHRLGANAQGPGFA